MCASSDVISQSKNEVFIAEKKRKMTKKDISPVCHDVVGETKIHWIKWGEGGGGKKVVERDKMVKLRCLKVENRTQDNNNNSNSNNNIQHSHQKVDNVVNICVFEFISLIL